MHNNEWEQLVRALTESTRGTESEQPTGPALQSATAGAERDETEQYTIERLVLAALPALPPQVATEPLAAASSSSSGTDGSSTAVSVLKTIGMVAGVGPLVTGLLKIFGGGDEPSQPAFAPIPFDMPEPISVEAGLAADRVIAPISYSQQGIARDSRPASERAPIQINVQAMDSRSFLDHRDEIAQAVREAMLQSHSLNDVMAEI